MPDRDLFVARAERHRDMIFRLAYSRLNGRADADDVTQTVLLRLWETGRRFDSDEHLKYWLIRVTLNECRRHWRSPWSRTEDLEEHRGLAAPGDPQAAELLDAVMSLAPNYRVAVYLHYYEGYSIDEIARLLHVPKGTVGTRLARARQRLKQLLSEEEMK